MKAFAGWAEWTGWTGKLLVVAVACAASGAFAIDAGGFKRVTDRMGSALVNFYDVKGKGFGTPEQQKDVELTAMIVAGLCGSPREYREANGPFVSEPVKFLVAQIKDDGSLQGSFKDEAAATAWVAKALKSTENEKYKALIEKLHGRLKKPAPPASIEAEAAKLAKLKDLPAAEQADAIAALGHAVKEQAKTEITVNGNKVVFGQFLLDTLDALENKTGMVSSDLRVNALAYNLANAAYKAMK